jgi:adenylate kinase
MLREALRSASPLGLKAKGFMEKGGLVPDEIVIGLVRERLSKKDAAKGFILDGFPRTSQQAQSLDETLNDLKMPLDIAIYFKTSLAVIIRRLSGRRICSKCGKTYHLVNFKPKIQGCCDDCGGDLMQRPDDREEVIENRLKAYEKQTAPLIDYYKKKKILAEVSGDLEMDDLSRSLEGLFLKKGLGSGIGSQNKI